MQMQPDENVKCDVEGVKMYFPEVDCSKRLRMKTYVSCLGKTGKTESTNRTHKSLQALGLSGWCGVSKPKSCKSSEVAETPSPLNRFGVRCSSNESNEWPFWREQPCWQAKVGGWGTGARHCHPGDRGDDPQGDLFFFCCCNFPSKSEKSTNGQLVVWVGTLVVWVGGLDCDWIPLWKEFVT